MLCGFVFTKVSMIILSNTKDVFFLYQVISAHVEVIACNQCFFYPFIGENLLTSLIFYYWDV